MVRRLSPPVRTGIRGGRQAPRRAHGLDDPKLVSQPSSAVSLPTQRIDAIGGAKISFHPGNPGEEGAAQRARGLRRPTECRGLTDPPRDPLASSRRLPSTGTPEVREDLWRVLRPACRSRDLWQSHCVCRWSRSQASTTELSKIKRRCLSTLRNGQLSVGMGRVRV